MGADKASLFKFYKNPGCSSPGYICMLTEFLQGDFLVTSKIIKQAPFMPVKIFL
jgi:hypothetical protein